MKKYLMGGIAAVAICAAFTSCSKNNELFDQNAAEQQKQEAINKNIETAKANYAAAFEKAFGKVGSNVDWGFGGAKANTRAANEPEVVKKDVWKNFPDKLDGNTVPADVTTEEAAYVYEWFQKDENKGLTEEGQPWENFFIQQVYGTMSQQKKGIWHRYDQNRINNGYDSNYYDEEFTDKGGMDYLTVGDGTTMTHVNDFNAETGGPWNIVYMRNSSAMKFGYHGSWDNSDRQLFKLAKITVPGNCFKDGVAREGWYVGLSLLAEKDDNGKKVLGEQRKDWGDDWILKVVPGKGEIVPPTPTTYRVIAEDLNAEQASDFDFNDVVFDVVKAENNKTTLRLIACGGIYKLTVAGVEVHEKFGQQATDGKYPMINTGAKADINGLNPVEFEINGTYDTPEAINNIEIRVWKPETGEDGVVLTAEQGKAACKILVDDSFEVVQEKQGIGDEYGLFSSYVQGGWDPIVGYKWWLKK